MPAAAHRRRWPLLLIASPAAVAIWSGWVALGGMCGFGPVNLLPGIGRGFTLNTAITLPVGVEAYGAYALGAWLLGGTSERARTFACRSAIGALVLGMAGQIIYHLLAAAHATRAPWPVVVVVACMPVVTLGFGAALTHLLHAEDDAADDAAEEPADGLETEPSPAPAPVLDAAPSSGTAEAGGRPLTGAAEMPLAEAAEEPPGSAAPAAAEEPPGSPRRSTAKEPRSRKARTPEDPEARRARAEYRKSAGQGKPLSDRALAAKFGRSRTWAAARIAEVKDGPALTAQVTGGQHVTNEPG